MSTPAEPQAKPGLFYGWYVVAGTFVLLTVTCGLGFYNLTLFLKAFIAQEGFSVADTSYANAAFFLSSGIASFAVAPLIDRYDPRYTIMGGIATCSVSILLAGHVSEVWELYGFYILFGIGNAAATMVPATTLVARWFVRQRARALAYASTGLSMGAIAVVPISAPLIESLGIAGASPYMAAAIVLIPLPICLFVLRPSPASMGLAPDGDEPKRGADGAILPPDGVGYGEAIRSRFFIGLTVAYCFSMMAQVATLIHQFRLVAVRTDDVILTVPALGVEADAYEIAAFAVSITAVASITGRLVGGYILARVPSRTYLLCLFVLQAAAFLSLAFAYTVPTLYAASFMFGLTVGNLQMMQPLMIAEAFGLKAYARITSTTQMIVTCANAAGPALLGGLYELAGGYNIPYLLLLLCPFVAFLAVIAGGPVSAPMRHSHLCPEPAD